MRFLALVFAWLLTVTPALAVVNQQTTTGAGHPPASTGTVYTGAGDVVSGATAWYGLRAYNSAYRGSKAINVRRASDNTTQDINVLAGTGALDIASANTFAGTDATCTGTISTTTLTCASASSTPHVGSTITGAGITEPCYATAVGTFTGGAGTVTIAGGVGASPCGTVSVGETVTLQYGLYVTEAYDQTGNGNNITQATAGSQPQLLPVAGANNLPVIAFSSAQTLASGSNFTPATGIVTISAALTQIATGSPGEPIEQNGAQNGLRETGNNPPEWKAFGSASLCNTTANLVAGTYYATTVLLNGASSTINTNGTEVGGSCTGSTAAGLITVGGVNLNFMEEVGFWDNLAFSLTQRTNVTSNQRTYWGF